MACTHVRFFSALDEVQFFDWLQKIKSIEEIKGSGDTLYIGVRSVIIPDADLRELIALFYRYKIDMKQLSVFLNDDNNEWFFGKPKGYWHRRVFGA